MNVTSTANTQYIPQVNNTIKENTVNKKESVKEVPHHNVGALDEKANKILDKLLEGKDEKTKTATKFFLDFLLNSKLDEKSGLFLIDNNASTSKEAVLGKIDKVIENLKLPGQADMLGKLDILENLKALYLEDYSPLDIKA